MAWPDVTLPVPYILGFAAVGLIEHSGVYAKAEHESSPSRQQLLSGSQKYIEDLMLTWPVNSDSNYMLQACEADWQFWLVGAADQMLFRVGLHPPTHWHPVCA